MKSRKYWLLITYILLMVLITGCRRPNNETPEKTPTTDPDTNVETPVEESVVPTFGETLKLAIRNPVTLNPLLNEEHSVDQVLKLVYDSLFTFDKTHMPVPVLVETYDYSADDTAITLVLRTDKTFQDGTPITAYDVEYSIQELQNAPATAIYKSCINNIQRTSVLSDNTIKLYFKQPYGLALYQLIFPIVSKNYQTSQTYDPMKPMGSGWYQLSEFISMQHLNLKATEAAKKAVYVENIECTITRNDEVEGDAFEQNLIDMLIPTKFDWMEYSDNPNRRVMEYTTNYLEFIGFNFKNPLFQDKNLRKAIAFSIDRTSIAQDQYLSHVTIADGLIFSDSAMNNQTELKYPFSLDEAKNTLAKTSFKDTDGDGFLEQGVSGAPAKIDLKLLVNKDNPSRVSVANMIKDDLAQAGLFVTVDPVDVETFKTRLKAGDYDLVLTGWKLSEMPDFTTMFHSTQILEGNNFIQYSNEFMDNALKNVYSSTPINLAANVQALNTLYMEELPYFSLYFMHSLVTTNQQVYGELAPSTDSVLRGIENIYISR